MSRAFSILLAAALAGCARFEPQPISPADTAAQLGARRLDEKELKRFLETNLGRELGTWPLKLWDLNTLTLAAFYFNPSLEVARAQWRVADAGVRTAGGRPNPNLNLVPGYDSSAANGLSPWIPFFSIDVPLETAGKRGQRIARARQSSEAARLNIASVAWQVRRNVRARMLDFTVAGRRSALLEGQLAGQQQIVTLLAERLAAGALSRPEMTAARIALEKTRLELGDAKSKQAEARAGLAEALRLSDQALDDVEAAFDFSAAAADQLTSAEARRIALRGRADILRALADYAATEAELRLQIAKQFPDLRANPGYQFDQGDNKWSLGIAFELPVLNQNQGPIAEARARREEVAARFTELQAKVMGEIERAVAAYRTAREQLAAADSLVAGARQQQRSVEEQFKAGAADQLDLFNAQFELGVATLGQFDWQTKVQQSLGALEDALQRPVDSTESINSTSSLMSTTQERPGRSTGSAARGKAGGPE